MLTVLDYGGGNLKSVVNVLKSFDLPYRVSNRPEDIDSADRIIFPGQGHFGQVMNALTFQGLAAPLIKAIRGGIPFLGICVGLQVLFESSQEASNVQGLSLFKGNVVRFTRGKTPQIGWNRITTKNENTFLTDDFFYFVNSYHVVPENGDIVSAVSDYHVPFVAAVQQNNVFATQFHPEKSGQSGRNVIDRWLTSFGQGE